MARIVIGTTLAAAFIASAACSGSSSTTLSPASPSTFSAQAMSATNAAFTTQSTHDHGEGNGHGQEAELEGPIVSVDAAHHAFVVRTTTVTVSPDTIIRHGHTVLSFADLAIATQVHVKGTRDGDTIAAREIKVQREGGDGSDEHADAHGVVAGLAGTCPALTFTVGGTKVATDAATRFGHAGCAQVVNGAQVEVKGAAQPDGSILASRVSLSHEDGGEDH